MLLTPGRQEESATISKYGKSKRLASTSEADTTQDSPDQSANSYPANFTKRATPKTPAIKQLKQQIKSKGGKRMKQPPRAIEITSESDEEMKKESTPTFNQPNIKRNFRRRRTNISTAGVNNSDRVDRSKRSTRTSRTTTSRKSKQAQNRFFRPQHNGYTSNPKPRS